MTSRRALLLLAGLAVALPAAAHHAWIEIDTSKTLTLTGTVKELHWENPHSHLVLETADGDRKVAWDVQMSGIARMESRGLSAKVLARGTTLVIVASPSRTEAHAVRANQIKSDGKDYVLY